LKLTKLESVWLLSTADDKELTVATGTDNVTDTSLTSTVSLAVTVAVVVAVT